MPSYRVGAPPVGTSLARIREARFHLVEESSKDVTVAVRLFDRCEVGAIVEDHALGAADASDQGP